MPSLLENNANWTTYDWDRRGEEWSSHWGSSETIWFGTLLPRLHEHLPARRLLEIAPGFGRMTQYLVKWCSDYTGIDLTPKCVAHCLVRFDHESHARFAVNDGLTLDAVEDGSIDFVFSWDSLVHAERDVLQAYLAELGRKLAPGGAGFIHHSNMGEYQGPDGTLSVPNPHWRGSTMTAALFRQYCVSAGLRCITQELVSWDQESVLNDCFSYFTRDASPSDAPTRIVERPDFFRTEVQRLREVQSLYSPKGPAAPVEIPIDWRFDADTIVHVVSTCRQHTMATAWLSGQPVRLLDAELGTDPELLARTDLPGTILKAAPRAIVVQTGKGPLVLRQLEHQGTTHLASALTNALGAARFDS
jgi:SAM-dependent methyltransferase